MPNLLWGVTNALAQPGQFAGTVHMENSGLEQGYVT